MGTSYYEEREMSFFYPAFLWFLIPLAMLYWLKRNNFVHVVHLIVLMLITLSLARPIEEKVLQETAIEAKNIMIAIDVSYSMRATDIQPTRYDFAKATINALLEQNPGDNIMLIAFTTNPLLLSPPTTDYHLIRMALQSLNPDYILTKGTSLKKLFEKLASINPGAQELIVITDGGEENNLVELTAPLQQSGLHLNLLALGTVQGTTITNKEGSLLKDSEGNLVITRLNPLLKSLTEVVEGNYLTPSATPESTATNLYDTLKTDTDTVEKMQQYHKEFYQFPLFFALILFLMLHTRLVKYLALFLAFSGIQAHASFLDSYHLHTAYSQYNNQDYNATRRHLKKIDNISLQSHILLANSYYKQGKYKRAIAIYKSIRSRSTSMKETLYCNIGSACAQLKKDDRGKKYYAKTLQLGFDQDASHNLHHIALLEDKESADLGIAHPQSQSSESSKSENQESSEKERRSEDQPSSGSGSGGEMQKQKQKNKEKEGQLLSSGQEEKHPLSSKTYELINKGYIREKQPW
jgi:Ca-activated chloride channel family protein